MSETLAELFALLAEEKKRNEEIRLAEEKKLAEEASIDIGDFFSAMASVPKKEIVEFIEPAKVIEPEIVLDLSNAFSSVLEEISKVKELNTQLKNASFEDFVKLTEPLIHEPIIEVEPEPIVEVVPVDVLAPYLPIEEKVKVVEVNELDSLKDKFKKLEKAFEDFKKSQAVIHKKTVISSGGGGAVNIKDMDDVKMLGAATGKVLSYDSSIKKFILVDPIGGSVATTGEISSEAIASGKVVYINDDGLLAIASSDNLNCIGKIVGFSQESVTIGTMCHYGPNISLTLNGVYYLGLAGSITLTPMTTGFIQKIGVNGVSGFKFELGGVIIR